jgi:beta-galactosidase/beta-glucuronidase
MKNMISELGHRVLSLTPTQAEVWVTVVAEHRTSTTEVRGRFIGPRCSSRTTIEVSYPLQGIANPPQDTLTVRAVIPEPSMWEPSAPYLYHAHIELWQDGEKCDEREFDLGLRMRG